MGDWDTPASGVGTTGRPAPAGGWGPALGGPGRLDLDRLGQPGPGEGLQPVARPTGGRPRRPTTPWPRRLRPRAEPRRGSVGRRPAGRARFADGARPRRPAQRPAAGHPGRAAPAPAAAPGSPGGRPSARPRSWSPLRAAATAGATDPSPPTPPPPPTRAGPCSPPRGSRPRTARCRCSSASRPASASTRWWPCWAPTAPASRRCSRPSRPAAAASQGKVVFDGRDITSLPAEKIAQLGLSLMPGGKGIFPSLTVAENLRLACWMLRHDRRKAREGLEDVLTMFRSCTTGGTSTPATCRAASSSGCPWPWPS